VRLASIAACPTPHYDEPMSFSETIFLFFLALIIFGPKKLPEIAKQAGRLLAELRRASNEFRSQIETEIAHLEVEKKQTILPPSGPPPGAVASLSLNPASSEAVANETRGTLAAPADTCVAAGSAFEFNRRDFGRRESRHPHQSSPSPQSLKQRSVSTPQDSHV
jgi:Sec-independent protein translocase protein TatA